MRGCLAAEVGSRIDEIYIASASRGRNWPLGTELGGFYDCPTGRVTASSCASVDLSLHSAECTAEAAKGILYRRGGMNLTIAVIKDQL